MDSITNKELINVMRGIIHQRRSEKTPAESFNAELFELLTSRLESGQKAIDAMEAITKQTENVVNDISHYELMKVMQIIYEYMTKKE